jgi:hypothetical protein
MGDRIPLSGPPTIQLDLTRNQAAAVAVALNALINDHATAEINPRWGRDAATVMVQLEQLRERQKW